MIEEVKKVLNETQEHMDAALEHLERQLTQIRAGKASPAMLDGVMVTYYGNLTPLSQVANVSALDARTLMIKPWERNMIQEVEKGIFAANIGLTPQNDGETIRLNIPPTTEERRRDLVKQSKSEGEHAKVSVRNIRKHANETMKKLHKDGLSDDLFKKSEIDIQKLTDDYIVKIDKHIAAKETEIMHV
ncbi:MAG: ribosome recycling factor [Chitinophagales bacterium]|nr:ribosome recycling factor [Chitinophagales bacterium]